MVIILKEGFVSFFKLFFYFKSYRYSAFLFSLQKRKGKIKVIVRCFFSFVFFSGIVSSAMVDWA